MATTQQRLLRLAPTKDSVLDRRLGIRGEVLYDDTNRVLRIYDGELLGGYELLRADLENIDVTILNSKLTNSTVQFGSTTVSLGGSSTTLAGLTSVTATTFNGALTGNVTGNVSGNVTGNVSAGSLTSITGMNFASGVTVSEFSSDNTFADNASSKVAVQSATRQYIDKRLGIDHAGNPVAQNNLIGSGYLALDGALAMKGNLNLATYNITNGGVIGAATVNATSMSVTNTITGSVSGNAGTVTNGVYTNQTYNNPTWLNTLALSKVGFTTGKSFDYNATATPALSVKATAYTADFGASPVTSKSFTITDANATADNSVMIYPVGDDEWEMDPIAYSARCNAGTITLYASTSQGPVKGTRSIRYVLV
jgi:hypothetical protein